MARLDLPICEEGQTARLLAAWTGPPQTALLVVQGEGRLEGRPVRLERGATEIPITVAAGLAPNFDVELLVPGEELFSYTRETVRVFPRGRFLDVELSTEPRAAKPGEKVRVETRTLLSGKPIGAEVELSVFEESASGEIPVPIVDLRKFFCSPWTLGRCSSSSVESQALAVLGLLVGLTADDHSIQRAPPNSVLWAPRLETGPDGRAAVEFRAPAGPCRLRIIARAVSGADRFGTATSTLSVER